MYGNNFANYKQSPFSMRDIAFKPSLILTFLPHESSQLSTKYFWGLVERGRKLELPEGHRSTNQLNI